MMRLVIFEMTSWAGREEVFISAMFGNVVAMSAPKDHDRTGDRMSVTMAGPAPAAMILAAFTRTLALATRALEPDSKADLFPVLRIAGCVGF